MVEAFRPPSPSAASDELDAQLAARRRWLGEARSRPPAFAAAVLDAWRERPEAPAPVQSGLLEAAAIADPESAAPVLVDLVSRYGPELQVRTDACRILGAHCPEVALELFPPILEDPQRSSTAPPDDAMLSAWLTAVRSTGADPGRLLTFLATDQQRGHATRHLAIRALGDFPGRVTIAALEEVLMESSGNAYMRRLAAQSIVKVGASEEVCPILQRVYDREADLNFQLFLHAVIEENCP